MQEAEKIPRTTSSHSATCVMTEFTVRIKAPGLLVENAPHHVSHGYIAYVLWLLGIFYREVPT
jgi:hypothetical protein